MNNLTNIVKIIAPTHIVRHASVELSRTTKDTLGQYVERPKRPGEVRAADNDLWRRDTYRTGDGDHTAQVPRAGSLVAFSLPSKGSGT